jgi:hypothetical protein
MFCFITSELKIFLKISFGYAAVDCLYHPIIVWVSYVWIPPCFYPSSIPWNLSLHVFQIHFGVMPWLIIGLFQYSTAWSICIISLTHWGAVWSSGLGCWTQWSKHCGFNTCDGLPHLWPWASHFTSIASSFEWDIKLRFLVLGCPCEGKQKSTHRG